MVFKMKRSSSKVVSIEEWKKHTASLIEITFATPAERASVAQVLLQAGNVVRAGLEFSTAVRDRFSRANGDARLVGLWEDEKGRQYISRQSADLSSDIAYRLAAEKLPRQVLSKVAAIEMEAFRQAQDYRPDVKAGKFDPLFRE